MAKHNVDAAQRRRELWREILRGWQSSGLSQAAFCRQRKIPVWKFTWWKKRLSDDSAASGGLFVPVRLAHSAIPPAEFELTLRGGRLLRFGGDVQPGKLAAIVAALDAIASDPADGPVAEGRAC